MCVYAWVCVCVCVCVCAGFDDITGVACLLEVGERVGGAAGED